MFHVKHMDAIDQLCAWLAQLGLSVGTEPLQGAVAHLEWVLRTNRAINLTAVTEFETALRLHVLDSLVALPLVDQAPDGLLVDLGSGGGFPGVPLALATGRSALLVDSVAKKLRAVDGFLKDYGLSGQIGTYKGRSEELAAEQPGQAAVVTARAVADLPVLVELAAPLLGQSGALIALKGRLGAEELQRAADTADIVGLSSPETRSLVLPGGTDERVLVKFTRESDATIPLPRRVGLAAKRPLA